MANLGTNLANIFNSIGAGGLANVVSGSSALMSTATDWEFAGEHSSGTHSSVSYNDLVGSLNIAGSVVSDQYSSDSYYNGGYTDGNTSVNVTNYSSINSSSTTSEYTMYDVGNRSGYLNGYTPSTGTLHFVDADIQSWTRDSDYVNFNMGNGTSFVAQTTSSTDDIFQYTTDGVNTSYAKIGYTNRDNMFQYVDNVTFIGSNEHEDTLNVSTYDKSVDLRGNQYISVDNIDARNYSNTYSQRQLTGNSANNKIYGAAGNTLWGEQGNDELYGSGVGGNTYLYGVNEGNDIIYQSTASDHVDLYNVSLSDIHSYGYDGNSLRLNMYNGDSLTVVGSDGASNFILADRSEYSYNRSTDTWSVKA